LASVVQGIPLPPEAPLPLPPLPLAPFPLAPCPLAPPPLLALVKGQHWKVSSLQVLPLGQATLP
jgi:hypothetical protein